MLSRYADPQTDLAHSSLWALHRLSTRGLGRVSLCVHVVSPAYGSYSWLSKLDFFWGGFGGLGPLVQVLIWAVPNVGFKPFTPQRAALGMSFI